MSVYITVLKPGDTILGMNLSHGGHLTHGHPLSFSGKEYNVVAYGVRREDERIDYEQLAAVAREHRPGMIIAGASAYPREIDFRRFAEVAEEVGAVLMVDIAHIAGLIIAGLHGSPVPHAPFVTSTTHKTLRGPRGGFVLCRADRAKDLDRNVFPGVQGGPLEHVIAAKAVAFAEAATPEFADYQRRVVGNARALAARLTARGFRLVSGGTDNHLMLVDVGAAGLSGKEAEKMLESVGLTVNKNTIPFDTRPPLVASGIRIGTPAITTRGMGEAEMDTIGDAIARTLESRGDAVVAEECPPDGRGALRGFSAPGVRARRLAAVAAADAPPRSLPPPEPAGRASRAGSTSSGITASKEPALRRLAGSGAASDRAYFAFLESARRRIPPGTRGVAIFVDPPTKPALYLASYVLAPTPVVIAPRQVPPRWIAAVYGVPPPAGWRVLATLPGGALLDPP